MDTAFVMICRFLNCFILPELYFLRMKNQAVLYIMSGLPACGKTTLAERLAAQVGAVFLRIDTIEQVLRDLCSFNVQGEGYRLAYRMAADNLRIGNSVVADSCNPIQLTRDEWQTVAESVGSDYENIEVICSDLSLHRERVENRECTVENLILPDWNEVLNREYHKWNSHRHVIDTAHKSADDCFAELLQKINLSM